MTKVGLPEHRYTLAILNGLYLVSAVPAIFLMIFRKMYLIPFIVCCICTILGSFGCFVLMQKDNKLMVIYRKTLLGVLSLQILAFISTLVILLFRSFIAEMYLKHLMEAYYIDESIKDLLDSVQLNFECCGLNGYKDWPNSLPLSCCGASVLICNSSLTKFLGCKENVSMFMLLICLAFLFVSTGNIILHAYCIHCAFELSQMDEGMNPASLSNSLKLFQISTVEGS